MACSRLNGHIQPSKRAYFTLQRSGIKLVRPLSTVDNTRDYARVSHSRQWSNYNLTHLALYYKRGKFQTIGCIQNLIFIYSRYKFVLYGNNVEQCYPDKPC